MRKIIKIMPIILILSVLSACSNRQQGSTEPTNATGNTGSVNTEDTTYMDNTISETTTSGGLISNSAGIVIRDLSETTTTVTTKDVPDNRRGIYSASTNDYFTADDDMQRLGVSKKVVFACLDICTYNLDKAILSRFNELLVNEYGCDFVMELVGLSSDAPPGGYDYYDKLSDMKNLGHKADIITADVPAHYYRLADEGFLVDITEYLAGDAEGQKLYNAYPSEIWNMVTIDGRIYGYTPYSTPLYTYALSCNKVMAEKFGLKVEDNFTLYDIGRILEEAGIPDNELENIVPFFCVSGYTIRMLDCQNLGRGVYARKDADGNWTAFNATEDEEVLKLWKTLRSYKEKGWLETGSVSGLLVDEGSFIFSATLYKDAGAVGDKIMSTTKNKKTVYEVIPGEKYYAYYGPRDSIVYGIASWSENKEEALKLITLMQTEEELCNLLRYGIENKHYVYENRKVTLLPGEAWGTNNGTLQIVNPNLTYPEYLEPDNKPEFYRELSSHFEKDIRLEYSMSTEEFYDLLNSYDQSKVLYQIYDQGYTKLMKGEYEDVEAAVKEINRLQKKAGIDELIDALNERFRK